MHLDPVAGAGRDEGPAAAAVLDRQAPARARSEEHTSELQSLRHHVCRLLLEKKKKNDELETKLMLHGNRDGDTTVGRDAEKKAHNVTNVARACYRPPFERGADATM